MPIMFNTILLDAGVPLTDVCLLRHQDQRSAQGRTPDELWRDNTPAFDCYQSHQRVDGRSKFTRANHWASFVGTPGGQTLFVGIYQVNTADSLTRTRPYQPATRSTKRAHATSMASRFAVPWLI